MEYQRGSAGISSTQGKPQPGRLMDEVRRCLRVKHYSLRTEQAYVGWIRRFILASGKRHPKDMGGPEVERFLSNLAVQGRVAASTQNQALSALLFLYREVLAVDLPWLDNVVRAKRPQRVPSVLSREEVQRLLSAMEGRTWLLASLLYGTGMRLMECLRLRVKDVDFARNEITVREGKGGKDRHTVLPRMLLEPLRREIERARLIHQRDLTEGFGGKQSPGHPRFRNFLHPTASIADRRVVAAAPCCRHDLPTQPARAAGLARHLSLRFALCAPRVSVWRGSLQRAIVRAPPAVD